MMPPSPPRQRLLMIFDELNRRVGLGDPSGELRLERAGILARLGREEEARDAYVALLAVMPTHFSALNNLGALLASMGHAGAARSFYREAVKHHPDNAMGHINLGSSLEKAQEFEEARDHFAAALLLDPDSVEANRGMAYVLTGMGEEATARPYREKGFRGHPILTYPYRGEGIPIQLLVLGAAAGGAVPIRAQIDDRIFSTTVLFADFADPAAPLPPHRLIFNAIGDADLAGPALEAAVGLVARSTAPVINQPEAVLATGRAANAERLTGIPGLVAPKMAVLPRDALPDAAAILAERGISFPCLLRSPGFHTGFNFVRIERPEALEEAATALPGETLVAIEYLDASGADGKIRKYRVMLVDGELYPLHLAVAHDWKVHYYTADMAENAAHRAEDQRFLDAMDQVLTADQRRTLAEIAKALELDYGGIDFGIDRAGNVLLFEANATMVVPPPAADERWNYRRAPVQRILQAIRALLRDRAELALRLRLETARSRYDQDDWPACGALCEEALRHGPPTPALLHLLGAARYRQGFGETAATILRQALETAPEDLAVRLDLAQAETGMGRGDLALATLSGGGRFHPGDARLAEALAEQFDAAGETELAHKMRETTSTPAGPPIGALLYSAASSSALKSV